MVAAADLKLLLYLRRGETCRWEGRGGGGGEMGGEMQREMQGRCRGDTRETQDRSR